MASIACWDHLLIKKGFKTAGSFRHQEMLEEMDDPAQANYLVNLTFGKGTAFQIAKLANMFLTDN